MYNLVWQRHVCQASADASWWENQMQHPTDPQTTVHFAKTCRTGYGLTTVGLRPSSVRPSPAPFASRLSLSSQRDRRDLHQELRVGLINRKPCDD
jgi:hypothetical protein